MPHVKGCSGDSCSCGYSAPNGDREMTFIEAVQALKDGRCKIIMREGYGFQVKNDGYSCIDSIPLSFESILATDWELVSPKPQTETVEVVRWMCTKCGCWHEPNMEYTNFCCNMQMVELKGSYTREIKPKVKRREEIGSIDHFKTKYSHIQDAKFYAEWEMA